MVDGRGLPLVPGSHGPHLPTGGVPEAAALLRGQVVVGAIGAFSVLVCGLLHRWQLTAIIITSESNTLAKTYSDQKV